MNDRLKNSLPGCSVLPPMRPPDVTEGVTGKKTDKQSANKTFKGTGNRFAEINEFVDSTMADLPRAQLATWLVLWRDTRDGTVRTSVAQIAKRIGASRRAVSTALAGLRTRGLLTQIQKGGMNRGISVYHVHSQPQSVPV